MDEQLDYLIDEPRPTELISIGEFAKQTQLSLKALRLYHDKGLLLPAFIDRFTNYRYYLPEQVQTAQFIKQLREMDMPLTMIEQFLELVELEPVEAEQVLQSYLQLFNARVAQVHLMASKVSNQLKKQESPMDMVAEREICLDDLPPVEEEQLLNVLIKVLDAGKAVMVPDRYRLVGTAASVLHGAKTPARSIDFIMTDRENVDAMHLVLSAFKVDSPPIYQPEVQLYWSSYFVDDIHVQVVVHEMPAATDGIETRGEGPWTHFTLLPSGSHMVPTVNLELRLINEVWRNRQDRVEPLMAYMRSVDVDLALLQRGMNETQIKRERQEGILGSLIQT